MQDWVFFGANLLFTAFNAWLAWEAWRRQKASDTPSVSAQLQRSDRANCWEIELIFTNPTAVAWRCKRAFLNRPDEPVLFYPVSLMLPDPASGEPWIPKSIDLSKEQGRSSVVLAATASPLGKCREVLWIKPGIVGKLALSIELESSDAHPRRQIIQVHRQIPALNAVIAS